AARAERLSRARPVYPTGQVEEHSSLADGRGADHPPGDGVLPGLKRAAHCRPGGVRQGRSPWFDATRRWDAQDKGVSGRSWPCPSTVMSTFVEERNHVPDRYAVMQGMAVCPCQLWDPGLRPVQYEAMPLYAHAITSSLRIA